jgi:hypothetical protein
MHQILTGGWMFFKLEWNDTNKEQIAREKYIYGGPQLKHTKVKKFTLDVVLNLFPKVSTPSNVI